MKPGIKAVIQHGFCLSYRHASGRRKTKSENFWCELPAEPRYRNVELGERSAITSLNQTGDDTIVAEVEVTEDVAVGPRQIHLQGATGTLPFYLSYD